MPKLNTTVKAVRIDNDKLEELEKKLKGQTINSWLNGQIENFIKGEKGVNPKGKKVNPEVNPTKYTKYAAFDVVPLDIIENIIDASNYCDDGLLGLMTALNNMIEDGILDTDLSIHRDEWIEKMEKFSKESGLPVEKVADKAIAVLKRGGV